MNQWDNLEILNKKENYTQIRYEESFQWKDLGITFLGFLFSVISTTETYYGCGYLAPKNDLIANLPKIKILKKPTALTTISFSNSTSTISSSEVDRLKLISAQLLSSNVKLLLVGSSDSIGDRLQNLSLAQDRAESVKNIFVKFGLSEESIFTMTNFDSDKGLFKDSVSKGVVLFIIDEDE